MKIIEALASNDIDRIKAAIEEEGVKIKDEFSNLPLHYAARNGNTEAIDLLIKAGSVVEEPNNLGETALMKAVSGQHSKAVKKLLDSKARPDFQDGEGYSSIHRAALNNDKVMTEVLMTHGGTLGLTTNDKDTVMHCAAIGMIHDPSKSWELIDWLLAQGVDYNKENNDDIKPEDTLNREDLSYGKTFQTHVKEILGDIESSED